MRTTLLLAFIIGILSFQAPQQAHACSCAMPGSTQESIDETDVIFSGTVEDVRASGAWRFDVSMTVDRGWKGLEASERAELTVSTAKDSAGCGYAFEEGEEYLVYGYRDEESGDLSVGLCSATKPLDQADEDVALLSEEGTWACTMDAKMCPDGSYVGRQGPNCEFAACPGEVQACTKELKICPDGTGVGRTGPNCAFEACPGEEPSCAPYVCANGKTHPSCSEDGHVINYFAEPCHMDGGPAGNSFSDVPATHADAETIAYVKSEGIVEGYADGTFKPDATINRAEFVKILMGAFEDDGRMCKIAPFSDVDQTAWYATYAHRARCQGVVDGYPDGTFRPASNINVAEAAKIMADVFFGPEEMEFEVAHPEPWYAEAVFQLTSNHYVPVSVRTPAQLLTRGEMAEMIYRWKTDTFDKPSPTYEELVPAGETMQVTVYKYSFEKGESCATGYDCDSSYVPVRVTVAKTAAVLKASLQALFDLPLHHDACYDAACDVRSDFVGSDLIVSSASVVNGVARVTVDGTFSSPGIGADARMEQEIERTIMQFPSVTSIDMTIAGTPWRCFGDQSGECR